MAVQRRARHAATPLGGSAVCTLVFRPTKMKTAGEAPMRLALIAGAVIAATIGSATVMACAAEIRLAEQFSMGYLQFNVMKRDRLIEKHATQHGLKDFKVSWQRFNGPVAMNEALLSNSTDIVSGGVPGLITLWDKTQGTSFEVKGICALSSQPFLLNTSNPDINAAFLDAVKEASAIIAADPAGTAQSWIDDSSSKLSLEMVTKVVTGP